MRLSIFSLSSNPRWPRALHPLPDGTRMGEGGVWDFSAWRRFLASGIKILRRSAKKMRCALRSLPSPLRVPSGRGRKTSSKSELHCSDEKLGSLPIVGSAERVEQHAGIQDRVGVQRALGRLQRAPETF